MTQEKKSPAQQFKEILERMENEHNSRRDEVTPLKNTQYQEDGFLLLSDGARYQVGENGLKDLCSVANIPFDYARRLQGEREDLLAAQLNHFFKYDSTDRMLRFKGDRLQGVVSTEYGIFDNFHLVETLWDKWNKKKSLPDFEIQGYNETDTMLHMRLVFPQFEEYRGTSNENGEKDIIRVAVDFNNSEVGHSRTIVTPAIYRLVCTNGMRTWVAEESLNQKHIHFDFDELTRNIGRWTDKSLQEGRQLAKEMFELKNVPVELPYAEIDRLGEDFGMTEKQIHRLKDCFLYEDEPTMYGIVNAFTRFARDVGEKDGNYDLRVKVEQYAGKLMHVAKR